MNLARKVIEERRRPLEKIVEVLFEKEVMDGEELRRLLEEEGESAPPSTAVSAGISVG